jgi:hypothetical protein
MTGLARGSGPGVAPVYLLSLLLALIAGLVPGQGSAQSAANPTVTLNPSSGPPGTSVTASGSGWASGSVAILWDGSQSRGAVAVSSDGTWRATFSVPADAAQGSHDVALRESTGGAAITIVKTFAVTAGAAGSPGPSVAGAPATGTGGYRQEDNSSSSNLLPIGLAIAGLVLVLGSLVVRRSSR